MRWWNRIQPNRGSPRIKYNTGNRYVPIAVGNTGYAPGSVYTVQLPEHLGYSTVSGEVTGIGATWAVDAATKTLSITFNQRVSDTLKSRTKSYLTTEAEPLIKIETPGKIKTYSFDLYEQVEPIQYNERTRTTG